MMPAIYYFLQVIVCSAVLYGYYLLMLKNKRFHQYNRFCLVAILLISWLIPFVRITLQTSNRISAPTSSFKFFEVIADKNTHFEEYISKGTTPFNWDNIIIYGYWLISLVIALTFIAGIVRILILLRNGQSAKINNAVLVTTSAKGTPFSFFHYIFWNNEIDVNSSVGKQILAHELVHVKERHSIDKLIASIVLITGWINPVFWLIKRELDMVQEFIADEKAVNGDAAELAKMLLAASYPSTYFSVVNSFFHSPIKRRITMMTKFNITRYPFLRRLMILPLLAIVVMLFAFRKKIATITLIDPVSNVVVVKPSPSGTSETVVSSLRFDENTEVAVQPVELKRVYKVMLDAGHGGMDGGAQAEDGTKESDISLQFVKTILEENQNKKIKLVLTRGTDEYQHPTLKVDLTKKNNADVLVSIHASSSANKKDNGIDLYVPSKDTLKHYKDCYLFANTLANTLSKLPGTKVQIRKRKVGIWIIDAAERPAVLIETGFLTNADDLKKLKDKNYQRQLAKIILQGIEMYLQEGDSAE